MRAATAPAIGHEPLLRGNLFAAECPSREVLQHVIVDVLDGSVGDFIRSHGGSVTAERFGDAVVLTLGGACEHCPAAGYTLQLRLLGELRRRCPNLAEIDSDGRALTLRLS